MAIPSRTKPTAPPEIACSWRAKLRKKWQMRKGIRSSPLLAETRILFYGLWK